LTHSLNPNLRFGLQQNPAQTKASKFEIGFKTQPETNQATHQRPNDPTHQSH